MEYFIIYCLISAFVAGFTWGCIIGEPYYGRERFTVITLSFVFGAFWPLVLMRFTFNLMFEKRGG